REVLHVDDLADALVFLMERYSDESHVNIGWGEDVSIAELATLVCEVVGFKGRLRYATDKPDGMPRKLLDTSLMSGFGWKPKIKLRDGLADACRWRSPRHHEAGCAGRGFRSLRSDRDRARPRYRSSRASRHEDGSARRGRGLACLRCGACRARRRFRAHHRCRRLR